MEKFKVFLLLLSVAMTVPAQADFRHDLIAPRWPLNVAINSGTGSNRLVCTDPDCSPYCSQLAGELDQIKDLDVFIFPSPLCNLP